MPEKKKRIMKIITIMIIVIFAAALALLAGVFMLGSFQVSTGRYIAADRPFILFDRGSGEPVIMVNPQGNNSMFSGLQTGDRILVVNSKAMMLSYPGQINVIFCVRLKKGDISDISEDIINSLEELGWFQGGKIGQNQ